MRYCAAALLALLLVGCGGGGAPDPDPGPGPGPDPNPTPQPDRVDFNGVVRDASGAPIADAAVLVGLNATTTDITGRFNYSNLLPGVYTVSLQDGSGNFDCRAVDLTQGTSNHEFALPAVGSGFRVSSVTPALGSGGAELNHVFRIICTEPVDPASVTAADFTITPGVDFTAERNSTHSVIIVPQIQLPLNQLILVELIGSISNTDGAPLSHPLRWRFRTSATDTFPPVLLSPNPDIPITNHPPNAAFRFEFNEPLAALDSGFEASVVPETELTAATSGPYLSFSAVGGWEINTHYIGEFHGAADVLGNRAATVYSFSFTTGDQPAAQWHIQPEWNAAADVIVYSADTGGSYDVFSINPDGTGETQLTMLPGDEMHPTLSNDGTLLAYQHRQAGKWSIYVQDIGQGGEPVQITADDFNDTEPYFSRTLSNKIVYVSDVSDPRGLFLANADGSSPVEQDRDFHSVQSNPALHPLLDTQMLFTSGSGDDQDIWRKTVSAIDGTAINQNLTADMLTDEHSPAWGPDASYFVFISDFDGVDNLWYAEATGEFPRQLTELAVRVSNPSVSPAPGDGRCVLSVDNDIGGSDLVLVDLVSGAVLNYLTGEEADD